MVILVSVISFSIGGLVVGLTTYLLLSDRFRSKLLAQTAIVATAGHQLRTPLNQILGMAQTLENHAGELPPKIRESIETIIGSGSHLKMALIDVLDFMELQSGELVFEPAAHSLLESVRIVHRVFSPQAEKKGSELYLKIDKSAKIWLHYDEVRVRQCIESIVHQCIEHAAGATVTISIRTEAGKRDRRNIQMLVHDGGPGMDQHKAEGFFQPAARKIDSRIVNPEGARLSLMLSRALARKMGGDLTVKSAYGSGVSFLLDIPAKIAAPRKYKTEDPSQPVGELAREAVRDKTMMIVDDNEVNVEILKAYLGLIGSTEPLIARNGKEALDLVASQHCDLILMDIQMPVMDGITATGNIRSSTENWKDVPIVIVSAASQSTERNASLSAGATGFLSKPVHANELHQKLVGLLT